MSFCRPRAKHAARRTSGSALCHHRHNYRIAIRTRFDDDRLRIWLWLVLLLIDVLSRQLYTSIYAESLTPCSCWTDRSAFWSLRKLDRKKMENERPSSLPHPGEFPLPSKLFFYIGTRAHLCSAVLALDRKIYVSIILFFKLIFFWN